MARGGMIIGRENCQIQAERAAKSLKNKGPKLVVIETREEMERALPAIKTITRRDDPNFWRKGDRKPNFPEYARK